MRSLAISLDGGRAAETGASWQCVSFHNGARSTVVRAAPNTCEVARGTLRFVSVTLHSRAFFLLSGMQRGTISAHP